VVHVDLCDPGRPSGAGTEIAVGDHVLICFAFCPEIWTACVVVVCPDLGNAFREAVSRLFAGPCLQWPLAPASGMPSACWDSPLVLAAWSRLGIWIAALAISALAIAEVAILTEI